MRYRFYREHKYLSFEASKLEKHVAKIDFADEGEVLVLRKNFKDFYDLMIAHAEHEDKMIHPLLKEKNPDMYNIVEEGHSKLLDFLQSLNSLLDRIMAEKQNENRISQGYQFYLLFRKFIGVNLEHLDQEENLIMPEIHKHYSDQKLKELVEFKTYEIITSEQMIEMCQILFPHMNIQDKLAFLEDIHESQPDKFVHVWQGAANLIRQNDQEKLFKKLIPDASDITSMHRSESLMSKDEAVEVELTPIVSVKTAQHFIWGDLCEGWWLKKTGQFNVISESMANGTSETKHYHREVEQFFYILEGQLTIELDDNIFYILKKNEGITVKPGVSHRVFNQSDNISKFLVISCPDSHEDRVNL